MSVNCTNLKDCDSTNGGCQKDGMNESCFCNKGFELDLSNNNTCNGESSLFGCVERNEGNVLFNDALNTFYLQLYCIGHMVKDHSYSESGNQLPPLYVLLFPISSKGSFICIIPHST